jgi:hypothetical protein
MDAGAQMKRWPPEQALPIAGMLLSAIATPAIATPIDNASCDS